MLLRLLLPLAFPIRSTYFQPVSRATDDNLQRFATGPTRRPRGGLSYPSVLVPFPVAHELCGSPGKTIDQAGPQTSLKPHPPV